MILDKLGRWARQFGWERLLSLLAIASIVPMLRFLPTSENLERLVADEYAAAREPFDRGELERAVRTLSDFLARRPGSPHESAGRLLLARALVGLAKEDPGRADDLLPSAADNAKKAGESGADPEVTRALRLEVAERLLVAGEPTRGIEVYEELRAEGGLPDDGLLMLARRYLSLSPPRVETALERIDLYLERTAGDAARQVDGLLARAETGLQAGRIDVVTGALGQVIARFPTAECAPKVRIQLARVLFRTGDRDAVETWLAPLLTAETHEGERAPALFWCGRADLARGRLQGAIARFQAVLEAHPASDLLFASDVLLASAFRTLRELRSAYAYLDDASGQAEALGSSVSPYLEPAEFLTEVRLVVQLSHSRELLSFGVGLCRDLSRRLPASRRGAFLALHANAAERLAALMRDDALAVAGKPDEGVALRARADEMFATAAASLWELVELKEPSLTPGRFAFQAGVDLFEVGRSTEAIRAFRRYLVDCLYEDPLQPRALYLMGACYRKLGRPERALEAYGRCIFQFPDAFPDSHFSRLETGACYEEKGEWEAAESAYLSVLQGQALDWQHPVWRRSLARLGEVHYRQHRLALARKDPEAATGALVKAIRRLEEYRTRYREGEDVEMLPVLRTLGACYLQAQDWAKAAEALTRAVEWGHSAGVAGEAAYREAVLLLADALYLKGDIERALAGYVEYRQRWGQGTSELWTLRQIARCQERRGETREAARYRELYQLALQRLGKVEEEGVPREFWSALVEEN